MLLVQPIINASVVTKVTTVRVEINHAEKAQKRLEVKARSTLMMGIPNEHQLKFNSIKDAKSLLEAIEKRFAGNAATKKTQRNLLKQHQLEILGEKLSQEDVNQKLLRSLSPEWNTHAVVWRNKPELETISMNENHTTISNAANSTNVDNLSDAVICAFFSIQPNNPQLVNEDLQQLHPDDLEEMDFRWQMTLLTMRSRRFLKNTGRKVTINENEETIRFWIIQVRSALQLPREGKHFSRECRTRNKPIKQEQGKAQKKLCQWRQLLQCFDNHRWSLGLESVEARLLVYKKNKSVYEEDIKVLKCEIHLREVAITELRRKLDLAQKQKDEIQLTVENFENSSKNLSKLLDCQIVDKCKAGLGYNVVPPPYTGNFMPPKHYLSFSSLEEFVNEPIVSEPTVKKPVVKTSEAKASADKPKAVKKNNGAPIIEDWVSDSEEEDVPQAKKEKKTVKSSFAKIEFVKSKEQVKSPRKTTVKQGNQNRQNTHSPRGNQRNWNILMSQRL
ncbi:hypothetical protein Tco_0108833 [Tanacetum coccineum]